MDEIEAIASILNSSLDQVQTEYSLKDYKTGLSIDRFWLLVDNSFELLLSNGKRYILKVEEY